MLRHAHIMALDLPPPTCRTTCRTTSGTLHQAAMRVLRYLKGTIGQGIWYGVDNDMQLKAYSDSDWASCSDTRKSITGYCVYLGSSFVSWKSKKQATVSKSSTEAEYRALTAISCEIQWFSYLLTDFGVPLQQSAMVYCDSKSAIHIAENPVYHERTKHIEIDAHVIRERVKSGLIKVIHIGTKFQIADLFTKSVSNEVFFFLIARLGVSVLGLPACGRVLRSTNLAQAVHNRADKKELKINEDEAVGIG